MYIPGKVYEGGKNNFAPISGNIFEKVMQADENKSTAVSSIGKFLMRALDRKKTANPFSTPVLANIDHNGLYSK